jgi:hypothetical protein
LSAAFSDLDNFHPDEIMLGYIARRNDETGLDSYLCTVVFHLGTGMESLELA